MHNIITENVRKTYFFFSTHLFTKRDSLLHPCFWIYNRLSVFGILNRFFETFLLCKFSIL